MTPCCLAYCTVRDLKLVAARGSIVDSPCPDIASHTSVAKWTPVNQAFLCNNAVVHNKLVPTYRSMVYSPCRHVTSHMPIARGTHIIIRFRTEASFPHSETVTACAAVIDLACAYSAGHRLIAMRTHVLETLAFLRGFCSFCRQRRRLRPVAAFLFATHICRPFCGHFCSVLLSAVFCLRRFFLRLGAILFSIPLLFRDGSPDISQRWHVPFFSSAALPSPCLLRVQDCRLRAFKSLNAPQRPYTHSVVGALRRLPAFKRVNRPQRRYTFCWWGFKSAVCQPLNLCSNSSTLRSGSTHCLVEASRPPFASLQTLHAPPRPSTLFCWGFKRRVGGTRALAHSISTMEKPSIN